MYVCMYTRVCVCVCARVRERLTNQNGDVCRWLSRTRTLGALKPESHSTELRSWRAAGRTKHGTESELCMQGILAVIQVTTTTTLMNVWPLSPHCRNQKPDFSLQMKEGQREPVGAAQKRGSEGKGQRASTSSEVSNTRPSSLGPLDMTSARTGSGRFAGRSPVLCSL